MNWTVKYFAKDGQVFTLTDVKWYEMQEAFNELSRQAYEAGTECGHVEVR